MRSTFARLATRTRPTATAVRGPLLDYGADLAAPAPAPVPEPKVPGRVGGVDVRLESGTPGEGGGARVRGGENAVATLGAQLEQVEEAMRSAVTDADEGIARTFDYVLARDRSRLRARLVLSSAAVVGAEASPPPAVITAAAAVELLHLAQRHHDTRHHDVRQAGEADVLVGDHLLARAVQLAIAVDASAGEELGRCVIARVRGQLLDDRDRYCVDRLLPAYVESCRARTALLTAVAAALGGRLAGGTGEEIDALRRYGEQLGLALQLTDDLRDVVTDAADTGNDLRTGIYTLPTSWPCTRWASCWPCWAGRSAGRRWRTPPRSFGGRAAWRRRWRRSSGT